jgi:hypothetical protein
MAENEAIECLKCYRAQSGTSFPEEIEMAINALEEVQQYRAIGTPEECLRNKDFLRFLANSMNQKKYETYLGIYNAVEKDGRDEE